MQSLFARGSTVACASLGLVEVMATLARKAKAREIGRRVLAVNRAKDVAREQALRGADAVHLASALMLQSRFADEDDRGLVSITLMVPVALSGFLH